MALRGHPRGAYDIFEIWDAEKGGHGVTQLQNLDLMEQTIESDR